MKDFNIEECTDKQFEKMWWSDFHETCKKCVNKCKQSHMVVLGCSNFKSKEKEDGGQSV